MRKFIFLISAFLILSSAAIAVAKELNSSALEVSGVVKSVSPVELRVSAKYGPGRYHLYIFKITDNTRIIGPLQKGAFVRVKYSQRKMIKAFIVIAHEVEVLYPPNVKY
jgi:hypothetical protein